MEKDVLDYVAHLARLSFNDPKAHERLSREFEKILSLFKVLEKVPTEKVEPTSHALGLKNVFREDRVQEFKNKAAILANFPEKEGSLLKVPKVIE